MPKHTLADRLYLGPIPDELLDLTIVEECMIARGRTTLVSPTSQRGLKG